jgi:hypothetical protein
MYNAYISTVLYGMEEERGHTKNVGIGVSGFFLYFSVIYVGLLGV